MRVASRLLFTVFRSYGFTLMELLVVLLIIGILSTVAIRTIDATRDRALFDQTTEEMRQLVFAITGNPNVTSDGKRVDFGFFGDMGRLPDSLRELVVNVDGSPNWHGPYFRGGLTGDSLGFLYDAWNNLYTYDKANGTIATIGNGKYPMTMKVVESPSHLYDNIIAGRVTDVDNNPPGELGVRVYLYTSHGRYSGYKVVARGGEYEFSPRNNDTVPVGTHRLVAITSQNDSIVKWVTVGPRSHNIVDFKFGYPFRSRLRVVGRPRIPLGVTDSSGFEFDIVSDYREDITLDSIVVERVSENVYFRILQVDHNTLSPYYPRPDDSLIGPGLPTAPLVPAVTIAPHMSQTVTFGFYGFSSNRQGTDTVNIHNKVFRFRFSDGSVIEVTP